MFCCWKELMDLLPSWLRGEVDKTGRDKPFGEIRLRLGKVPQFTGWNQEWYFTDRKISGNDLAFVVNVASQFSPYAAQSISQGYLTARGGHRVGLSGEWMKHDGRNQGMKHIRSVCIRVSRDLMGIAEEVYQQLNGSSVLILGVPGSGKTTLLRDLIRKIADGRHEQITVIDEREELFPPYYGGYYFETGARTDVLSTVDKASGIEIAVRTMSPSWVAVDEVTAMTDCETMERCAYSGVRYLATAHAGEVEDLKKRPVYRRLLATGLFGQAVVVKGNGEYTVEELKIE